MIEAPASRRLLVVDPCDDCYRLIPGLRAIGWDVDSCTLEHAAERTCDVGLIRLQPYHLEHPEPVKEFKVVVDLVADLAVINPFDFFVEKAADLFPFAYDEGIKPLTENSIELDQAIDAAEAAVRQHEFHFAGRPAMQRRIEETAQRSAAGDGANVVMEPAFPCAGASGTCR